MAGPTLQLNITAPGQKSVEASVASVRDLASALRGLPAAGAALAALQKQLAGVQAPSGLKTGSTDLKELIGEIKSLGAQLGTGFGSLEQTIQNGWKKAAAAEEAGVASAASKQRKGMDMLARQALESAEKLSRAQAAGDRQRLRAAAGGEAPTQQLLYGTDTAALAAIRAHYQGMVDAEHAGAARLEAEYNKSIVKLEAKTAQLMKSGTVSAYQPAGPGWWEAQIAKQEGQTARLEAEYNKSIVKLEAKTAQLMKAATVSAYQPAGPGWWEAQIAKQEAQTARLEAEYNKSITKLEAKTSQLMKAATVPAYLPAGPGWWEEQIAKQAAQTARLEAEYNKSITKLEAKTAQLMKAATVPAYQAAGAGWWEDQIAKQEAGARRLEAEYNKSIAKVEAATKRVMKAATQPGYAPAGPAWWDKVIAEQEAALARMQTLDARFAAASARGRASTVLTARSQLTAGLSAEAVRDNVGGQALAAAQATTLAQAYAAVHERIKPVNDQMTAGAPKVKAYGDAVRDLQSGVRGLASGFGQMSLIAASVIPLLAGTALSKGFMSSIRIGVETRQDLENIRVLSEESDAAVAGLEKQLISLGQTGPFGPRAVAEAMKVLSLAGLNAAEVSQALKPALDFAVTGGVGIEKAAESLVAIGTAYGFQANEFSTVADAVSKAAAVSMSSVEGMMESFRASSMIAQGYGVTLKDTAADLALLANVGIRGSAAGTALRQMYSELSGASNQTREAMKKLGVEVLQTNGSMRPAIDIVRDLNKALEPLRGDQRVRAIQDISNERGGKALIATLTAFQTAAKDAGSTAENEFVRIKQLIDESAGFDAIAASKLASTPQNLLKGVGASLEISLYEAFQAIEPTLVVLATHVREVFNSPEFRQGVTTAAELMAAFSRAVIENIGWLKLLGEAFLIFKGVQLLQVSLAGASAGMAFLQTSALGASLGVSQIATASAVAAPALGVLGTAARALSLTLGFLGPLTVAIGLAALAWQTYAAYQQRANDVSDAALLKQQNTEAALDSEIKRLETVNEELRKGANLRDAEAKAKADRDRLERETSNLQARKPLADQAEAAAQRLSVEEKPVNGVTPPALVLKQLRSEAAAAQARLDSFDAKFTAGEARISFKQQVVKSESAYLAQNQEVRAFNKPGGGTELYDDKNAKQKAAQAAADASELALIQKRFTDQQGFAKKSYDEQMKLLEIGRKGMLMTEAEYSVRSDAESRKLYEKEMSNLQQFIADSDAKIRALKGTPRESQAKGAIEQQEKARAEAVRDLNFMREQNRLEQAARQNQAARGIDTGIDKIRESVDLAEAKLRTSQKTAELLPREIAAEQAMNEVRAEGVKNIRKLRDELAMYEKFLDSLDSNEGGPEIAAARARTAQLRLAMGKAQGQVDAQASRAGEIAGAQYDVDNKPSWQKFVDQGQNAMLTLKASRDDFMNGWVDSGKTIWENFLETGKLSFSSLGKLFTKTLADITYQRVLAKPFAEAGQGLFDRVLKPVNNISGSTNGVDATNDLNNAFSGLGNAVGGLSDKLGGLGQDFFRLFIQAGNGLAALLNNAGASSAGGFLQRLFSNMGGSTDSTNGGTAAGSTGNLNNPWGNTGNAWAMGGAFGSGSVMAFAKGAGFHNSVLTQPTMFRYGAGLTGVAGEAGPEAVMPLTRTPSGELGVRNMGGGGGGVSVKTEIIIENHGSGPEPTVSRESKPDGSEMIRVIVGEVAKDTMRGGPTRRAQKTRLPRY